MLVFVCVAGTYGSVRNELSELGRYWRRSSLPPRPEFLISLRKHIAPGEQGLVPSLLPGQRQSY
jgi:hypothetical protein